MGVVYQKNKKTGITYVLEVPEDKAEEVKTILVSVMESAGEGFIDIPLVAEAAIADSWAGKA